ncbi:hypothetical protein BJX70DRAFT_408668 [Aspergillus crustosus]
MKPTITTTTLIPLLFTLFATTQAADCTDPTAVAYANGAREMMWSIRDWMCPNAWKESAVAKPPQTWCDAGGRIVESYSGHWQISGLESEQECWDITAQIIDQCMWYNYKDKNYNGGSWTSGNKYVGGWFYDAGGKPCQHPVKRDGSGSAAAADGAGTNFTLADGEVRHVDKVFLLDVMGDEAVPVETIEL